MVTKSFPQIAEVDCPDIGIQETARKKETYKSNKNMKLLHIIRKDYQLLKIRRKWGKSKRINTSSKVLLAEIVPETKLTMLKYLAKGTKVTILKCW